MAFVLVLSKRKVRRGGLRIQQAVRTSDDHVFDVPGANGRGLRHVEVDGCVHPVFFFLLTPDRQHLGNGYAGLADGDTDPLHSPAKNNRGPGSRQPRVLVM